MCGTAFGAGEFVRYLVSLEESWSQFLPSVENSDYLRICETLNRDSALCLAARYRMAKLAKVR